MSMMLDTRVVAPADRPGYWSAGIAEHFFPMAVESFGEPRFDARLTGGDVGPVAVRAISGGAHRVVRTSRMIASSDPESVLLYLVRSGACRVEQDDRACVIEVGDIAVQDTSRPSSFEARAGFDVLVLTLPKWFLGRSADDLSSRVAMRVSSADSPLLRMAAPLIYGFAHSADDGRVRGAAAEAAAEMLVPLLRGLYPHDESDMAATRAVLLQTRMRRFALAHLHDPQLGPDLIARAHYVSARYVHKLFEDAGGVSAWIRAERLERAATDLRETTLPVAAIAGRWGYRDAASFSRAFRKSRGHSPREARAGY